MFDINGSEFTSRTENGGKSVANMFCEHSVSVFQTDKFVVPPTSTADADYHNQWHLTAKVEGKPKCRFLTLVQILDAGKSALEVKENKGVIECGQWKIEANMSSYSAEKLLVRNVVYSYGSEHPTLNGETYYRNIEILQYCMIN